MTKGTIIWVLVQNVMVILLTSPLSEVMTFSSPLSWSSSSDIRYRKSKCCPTTTSTILRIFHHSYLKRRQWRRRGNPRIVMISATAEGNNEVFDDVVELFNTTVVASSNAAENQQKTFLDPRPRRERQSQWPKSARPERRKPSRNPDDDMNRQLNNLLPKRFQYLLRDIGFLRLFLNVSVIVGLLTMKQQYPSVLDDFLLVWFGWNDWTTPKQLADLSTTPQVLDPSSSPAFYNDSPLPRRRSVRYGGQSPNQIIELWDWNDADDDIIVHNEDSKKKTNDSRETIIFVHGGAWGTGFPAMYSLVALPFLRRKKYNVAVVGYRTYPEANILEQTDDVVDAIMTLQREQERQKNSDEKSSKHTYTLIGHSSGSHICSLAMARGMLSRVGDSSTCVVDRFISLAGVFDIREHYRFEIVRGLARISPMAPAAAAAEDSFVGRFDASSRQRQRLRSIFASWSSCSPLHLVQDMTNRSVGTGPASYTTPVNSKGGSNNKDFRWSSSASSENEQIAFANDILVVHSKDDTTCPYWYSEVFAEALREYNYAKMKKTGMSSAATEGVDLEILTSSGHAELVLELIYGGPTQDLVLDWLDSRDQV